MPWVCTTLFLLLLIVASKNRVFLRVEIIGLDLTLRVWFSLLDSWINLPVIYTLRPLAEGRIAHLFVAGKEKPLGKGEKRGKRGSANAFVQSVVKRGKVKLLRASFLLGAEGDAALTAKGCGAFLIAYDTLFSVLKAKNKGLQPMVSVTPDFQKNVFVLSLSCMIELSFGHIMEAALSAMFSQRKGAKV